MPARTVLVVDDERPVREAVRRLLESHGYSVQTAASGEEGLTRLELHAAQLLISDKDMPGMTGIELLDRVRARWPRVRRMMLTGRADLDDALAAINRGEVYRFLEKPFLPEHLLTAVAAAFETIELEEALRRERQRSDELLANMLPAQIAERLKQGEANIADLFPEATVLFADLVGFTPLSARLAPGEVVSLLSEVFSMFDAVAEACGVEKIKTLGDGYLAAAGLPRPRPDHAAAIAELASGMLKALARVNERRKVGLELRIGAHTGPVVAGVIGLRKFSYDLWGDTVNTASRMEATGLPGRVQVTDAVHAALGDGYAFERRGTIEVKGKGPMSTWFLLGRKPSQP